MRKVIVPYRHDPADLAIIYLAVSTGRGAPTDGWRPALRDTIDGEGVIWARFPEPATGQVWIQDGRGVRPAA
jgi:hypothetical protein